MYCLDVSVAEGVVSIGLRVVFCCLLPSGLDISPCLLVVCLIGSSACDLRW